LTSLRKNERIWQLVHFNKKIFFNGERGGDESESEMNMELGRTRQKGKI